MPTAFISHSSADKYFVDLLVKILEFHRINLWYDSRHIEPGTAFMDEIHGGLEKADILIAVISANSPGSKWIIREIATFRASKPRSLIVPVLLDDTDPDILFDGLRNMQAIPFYRDMLKGFEKLLAVFDREFLPLTERRQNGERRADNDRRQGDRRQSPLIMRLRKGFWNAYAKVTNSGQFDGFIFTASERIRVIEILTPEVKKYTYFDNTGEQVEIEGRVLDEITYKVWDELAMRDYITAVIVIEIIAEKINESYRVEPIDNRTNGERRGNGRRKQDC